MSTDQPPVPQQPHPMFPPPHPADSTAPPNPGVFSAPPTSGGYAAGPSHPAYPGYPAAPPQQAWAGWAPTFPLASWGDRVVAYLIDMLYQLPGMAVYFGGAIMAVIAAPTTNSRGAVLSKGQPGLMWTGIALAVLGFIAMMAVSVYNQIVVQGRTGQSWGKRRVGLRIIRQDNGQILTMGNNFLRLLCHYLDSVVYVGYLWPLWDPMRQTFADKIMKTVVVKEK
jgi:uncharacterized RDD family membrane protein YckC